MSASFPGQISRRSTEVARSSIQCALGARELQSAGLGRDLGFEGRVLLAAFQAALSSWTATRPSRSWPPQVQFLLDGLEDDLPPVFALCWVFLERQALVGCLEEALASKAQGMCKSRDAVRMHRRVLPRQVWHESSK